MYYKVWQAAFRLFVFPGPRPLAWSLALALAPGPCPNLYLPALASNLYLFALAPNLYLPALIYYIITSPGPEFCIHQPFLLNF